MLTATRELGAHLLHRFVDVFGKPLHHHVCVARTPACQPQQHGSVAL
jgi:hypothetical protein